MATRMELLNRALEMSEEELNYLMEGDYDNAERSSQERSDLIQTIISMEDDTREEVLYSKLNQLKSMQSQLTTEARRLHSELKQDLLRTKKETKRYGGYQAAASAAKAQPLMQSRFISKRG